MIIKLNSGITNNQLEAVKAKVANIGYGVSPVKTQFADYLVCTGKKDFDIRQIGQLEGIEDLHRVESSYKLVSREYRVKDTVIDLGDGVKIGRDNLTMIAGPCSVESVEHAAGIIDHLLANDIKIMRTMVFKPRSSPYAFRGIGIEGLRDISTICKEKGMKIISEVMQVSQIEPMHDYIDIFQVGARNTQNYNLLDALGKVDKAVLLKRGISGSISELLHSAEYIFSNGNEKIILCERGIRTFESEYRNTFDLNAIPILREKSHLPVVADPSHSIGIRRHVSQMAASAVMAGADGILVEVHNTPEKAFSDAQQTLSFPEAEKLYTNLDKAYDLRKEMNL